MNMNNRTKQKTVYGAGEGIPQYQRSRGLQSGPRCVVIEQPWPSGGGPPGPRSRSCVWRGGHGGLTGWDAAEARRRLRGRSASSLTGGSRGPQRIRPSPPTVATATQDAVRGEGTHPRGIRTPHGCRPPEKGRREVRGAERTPTPTPRRGRYCVSRRRCQSRRCRRQRRGAKRREADRTGRGTCDQGERETAPRSGGRGRRIPAEEGAPFGKGG